MMLSLFWLHAAILACGMVLAYVMFMRTLRIKAGFNLYRVRDAFVLLVARDILPEDSQVFRHYYERINALLAAAPKCGIDDVLQTVFRKFDSAEEFTSMMERARRHAAKLLVDPAMKDPDVRHAVADYYRAVQFMILTHSSVLRAAYLLSRLAMKLGIQERFSRLLPGTVSRGMTAIDYADAEARAFG